MILFNSLDVHAFDCGVCCRSYISISTNLLTFSSRSESLFMSRRGWFITWLFIYLCSWRVGILLSLRSLCRTRCCVWRSVLKKFVSSFLALINLYYFSDIVYCVFPLRVSIIYLHRSLLLFFAISRDMYLPSAFRTWVDNLRVAFFNSSFDLGSSTIRLLLLFLILNINLINFWVNHETSRHVILLY